MLDIRAIEGILPHRYPFLLVDRVDEIGGDKIVARKLVSPHCSIERSRKKILLFASGLCLMATPLVLIPGREIMAQSGGAVEFLVPGEPA